MRTDDVHRRLHKQPRSFPGDVSLKEWRVELTTFATNHDCLSLLDYGCGKGKGWRKSGSVYRLIFGFSRVSLFDPYYEPLSARPETRSDIVVCSHVIEHVPGDDLQDVLRDIDSLAGKCMFFVVALDRHEHHRTVESPSWWTKRLDDVLTKPFEVYYWDRGARFDRYGKPYVPRWRELRDGAVRR